MLFYRKLLLNFEFPSVLRPFSLSWLSLGNTMVRGQENFIMYFPKEQPSEAIFVKILVLESQITQLENKVSIYEIPFILLKLVIRCETDYKQLVWKNEWSHFTGRCFNIPSKRPLSSLSFIPFSLVSLSHAPFLHPSISLTVGLLPCSSVCFPGSEFCVSFLSSLLLLSWKLSHDRSGTKYPDRLCVCGGGSSRK